MIQILKEARKLRILKADYDTCRLIVTHLLCLVTKKNNIDVFLTCVLSSGEITSQDLTIFFCNMGLYKRDLPIVQQLILLGGESNVNIIANNLTYPGNSKTLLEKVDEFKTQHKIVAKNIIDEITYATNGQVIFQLCVVIKDYSLL